MSCVISMMSKYSNPHPRVEYFDYGINGAGSPMMLMCCVGPSNISTLVDVLEDYIIGIF